MPFMGNTITQNSPKNLFSQSSCIFDNYHHPRKNASFHMIILHRHPWGGIFQLLKIGGGWGRWRRQEFFRSILSCSDYQLGVRVTLEGLGGSIRIGSSDDGLSYWCEPVRKAAGVLPPATTFSGPISFLRFLWTPCFPASHGQLSLPVLTGKEA